MATTTNSTADQDKWDYFDSFRKHHDAVDPEVTRLLNQHRVFKDATGGELLEMRAQLPPKLRILDSGTAAGAWLRDLASTFPADSGNVYVGADIEIGKLPIPPSPEYDITYVKQDIKEEWPEEFKNSFDVVHQRLVLAPGAASGEKGRRAVAGLVGLVKPGGWIQLVEGEWSYALLGNKTETGPGLKGQGEAIWRANYLFRAVLQIINSGPEALDVSGNLKGWLEEAGCVDVQDRCADVFWGRNADPELAETGRKSIVQAVGWMAGFPKRGTPVETFQRLLPFPVEELDLLPEQFDAEMKAANGSNFPLRITWGRRPPA